MTKYIIVFFNIKKVYLFTVKIGKKFGIVWYMYCGALFCHSLLDISLSQIRREKTCLLAFFTILHPTLSQEKQFLKEHAFLRFYFLKCENVL